MRATAVERRTLQAIEFARRVVPRYADGTATTQEDDVRRLARFLNVEITRDELDHPTLILPPVLGRYRMILDQGLNRQTEAYVVRHELMHLIAGDIAETAEELLIFQFTGPLPEAEAVADLGALADLLTVEDLEQGEEWVAGRIEELVRVDYAPWYKRVPELAPGVVRLRTLIEERL